MTKKRPVKKKVAARPTVKASSDPPVRVALPNTTSEKMGAIFELSRAVHELALALNSTNIKVNISHCEFHDCGSTPIIVDADDKTP